MPKKKFINISQLKEFAKKIEDSRSLKYINTCIQIAYLEKEFDNKLLWLLKASGCGSILANSKIAELYELSEDFCQATKFHEIVRDQFLDGDAEYRLKNIKLAANSSYALGVLSKRLGNVDLANSYFLEAFNGGHDEAAKQLIALCGSEAERALRAYEAFSNTLSKESPKSYYMVGMFHYKGDYVVKDVGKSYELFGKGAEYGCMDACFMLAKLCTEEEKYKDSSKAIRMLIRASDNKHQESIDYFQEQYPSPFNIYLKDLASKADQGKSIQKSSGR